jgi:hypothetical protein
LADDGEIEIVQFRVERPAVKRSLFVCCSTVILGVCNYSETGIIPVLKSVTWKRVVECNRLEDISVCV